MTHAPRVHSTCTKRAYVLALALGLAGCGATPAALTTAPDPTGQSFTPDPRGLAVDGTGLRIDFGRAPGGVIAALDRALGPGEDLGGNGCPAGVTRQIGWGDLVLSFTDERFVGWRRGSQQAGKVCGALA